MYQHSCGISITLSQYSSIVKRKYKNMKEIENYIFFDTHSFSFKSKTFFERGWDSIPDKLKFEAQSDLYSFTKKNIFSQQNLLNHISNFSS